MNLQGFLDHLLKSQSQSASPGTGGSPGGGLLNADFGKGAITGGALGLLTLAGLPPGVAGLLAKIVVLRPLAADGQWWIALPAVAAAALGFAAYLRWVALVLQPSDDGRGPEEVSRPATFVALGAGLLLLVASILPVILLGAGTN